MTIGVLLVNLGTPDTSKPFDVFRYLNEFLTDPRVIDIPWLSRQLLVRGVIVPFRFFSSSKAYQKIWTQKGSPLKVYGEKLAEGVQEELGPAYKVVLSMRYQNPSIPSGLERLKGCEQIIVLPLFPQYASASTGSVLQKVMECLSGWEVIPSVSIINQFYSYPAMIELFARNAAPFDIPSYDKVLFSFHGLPERQIRKADRSGACLRSGCCEVLCEKNNSCYRAQCFYTAKAIANKLCLPLDRFSVCFQSRLGKDPWIEPYTVEVIKQLAENGAKRLLVFCPAFVADCLETIEEISGEYNTLFKERGGDKIDLVPSLNSNPGWVQAVSALVAKENIGHLNR